MPKLDWTIVVVAASTPPPTTTATTDQQVTPNHANFGLAQTSHASRPVFERFEFREEEQPLPANNSPLAKNIVDDLFCRHYLFVSAGRNHLQGVSGVSTRPTRRTAIINNQQHTIMEPAPCSFPVTYITHNVFEQGEKKKKRV